MDVGGVNRVRQFTTAKASCKVHIHCTLYTVQSTDSTKGIMSL